MKILHGYLIRETCIPFLLSLVVLTFVLLMTKLFRVAEVLFEQGVSLSHFFSILQSMALNLSGFTLPLAFLIGILISFGRLCVDQEILALRSSGVSLVNIAAPIFILSLGLTLFSLFLHGRILPDMSWRTLLSLQKLTYESPSAFLQEKTWLKNFGKNSVYIDRIYANQEMAFITIHQTKENFSLPLIISAKRGHYEYHLDKKEILFVLMDGYIDEPTQNKSYLRLGFGTYRIPLPISDKDLVAPKKGLPHRHYGELVSDIKKTPPSQVDYRLLVHEKHHRLLLSFSCLVFFLMGFPLSLQLKRGEKSYNLLVGALLALAWYLLLLLSNVLFRKGLLPVAVTTWLPNIIMGSVGLFFTTKTLLGNQR